MASPVLPPVIEPEPPQIFATDFQFGTDGDDVLTVRNAEIIRGGVLYGREGNDKLFGSEYRDALEGEEGNDTLRGRQGDDILKGGEGDDDLRGGQGNDILNGGTGADVLHGGQGNDILVFDNADFDSVDSSIRKDGNVSINQNVYNGGTGFDVIQVGAQSDGAAEINFVGRGIKNVEAVVAKDEATTESVTIGLSEIARSADDASGADKNAFTFIGNGGDDTLNLIGGKWNLISATPDDLAELGSDEAAELVDAGASADDVDGLRGLVFQKNETLVTIWTDLDPEQILLNDSGLALFAG